MSDFRPLPFRNDVYTKNKNMYTHSDRTARHYPFDTQNLSLHNDLLSPSWALTMLSKRNIGWASTCNTVGQTIGYFMGYLGFLALESPSFCNIFREEPSLIGCVTMEVGTISLCNCCMILLGWWQVTWNLAPCYGNVSFLGLQDLIAL